MVLLRLCFQGFPDTINYTVEKAQETVNCDKAFWSQVKVHAGLGTQYYVTTVSRDIFGRAMPGTYFRAESAYFKREKDDSRDILTAFKDRRRFLDISNYEKQKKKISCHMHFKESASKEC